MKDFRILRREAFQFINEVSLKQKSTESRKREREKERKEGRKKKERKPGQPVKDARVLREEDISTHKRAFFRAEIHCSWLFTKYYGFRLPHFFLMFTSVFVSCWRLVFLDTRLL